MILYSVCTEAHVWLEVTTLGCSCFFSFLLEWLDIGRPRGGPISPTVINLEKTWLSGADVGAGYVFAEFSEGLVYDADHGATSDSDSNHVGHMLEVAICEGFLAVNRINPHCDIVGLKLLSVGTCNEVYRGRVLVDDLREVSLILFCLPLAIRCFALEKARAQDGALTCL